MGSELSRLLQIFALHLMRHLRKVISNAEPHPLGEQWRYSRSPSPSLALLDHSIQSPRKKNSKKGSGAVSASKATLVGNRPITAAKTQKGPTRSNPTLSDKIRILDFMKEKGCSQMEVVKHFRQEFPTFSQPSLSRWRKQEAELREQAKNRNKLSYKKVTHVEFPEVEKALAAWAIQAEARKTQIRITEAVLRAKARHFAVLLGIPLDKFIRCSNGWAHKFKIRYQLRSFQLYGEAASVALEDVDAARMRLQHISKDFKPEDIYNLDESGLYYRMPPDRSLASKQMSGSKKDKTRISLVFVVNADGSHSFPVISIGHAKCPRPFNKKSAKELGFEYYWNKKAWMTGSIFQLYVVLLSPKLFLC